MTDTKKIKTVRKFHDLLNEGKLDEAHELLAEDLSAHTTAHIAAGAPPMSKAEVLESHQGIHQELEAKTTITDAKEVDGNVIVVGKSTFNHDTIKEVPFKATYEFIGNQIGKVHFETDPNHKVKSFSL
ncbi:hypothetical protein F5879DRAFT_1000995 [Lentinula edodes]|uniref:uncharacterized protein n=1 Tax=Lentinula edodes TaxID=5353 RepID=UPI001E8E35E7|nr:uncharacterized protein C8R40DRAFT_1235998 [Lentinula edodes]KAH7877385.1 hypothetical protein C8R40DRAFT_1235998 [Lentinula edodes]KAJ3905432.1 hypothetical protein F5879DRAFT_1000995 [Lentinula edodes]